MLALFGLPSAAQAADRYWDANGTATGSGGNGNWNTTDQVWSESNSDVLGPYRIWDNSALDNAIFGITAAGTTTTVGTVTLTQPITVHNMVFQTVNNWVISGNTLTLGGVTPTINTIGNTTINSIIAGTSGLTKTGGAQLALTGANTFSGGIILSGGTLTAANDAALGDASNGITTTANASLNVAGVSNRTVTIGAGTLLTIANSGTSSMLYTGSGSLNLNPGTAVTNDANTYTGFTRFNGVNQGSANTNFTSVRNLGEASSLGAPTTVADGTIQFIGGSQYSSSITYIGDGDSSNRNWVLGGGPTRVFVQRGTGALTLTGDISIVNAQFAAQTADFNLLGVISGTGGALFSASAGGIINLGSSNTFVGGAGVSGGVVRAPVLANSGVASSLGAGSSISLSNLGQLSYTGAGVSSDRSWGSSGTTAILNDGSGALSLSGNAAIASGTLTLGGSYAGTSSFSGVISGTGNLGSSGSGTWVLDGANTRTGTISVSGGTLRAGNASAFGTTTGIVTTGGTLDLNSFDMATTSLIGTGGTIALGSANLAANLGAGVSNSYGGSITGSGTLTKLGAGTLTLTGANTYTGATTIGGGTLALDFSPAGGPTSGIISASSALVMNGGALTVKGAAGEANVQSFGGLTITTGNNTVSATSGAGGSTTVDLGGITRTGGLANFVLPTAGAIATSNADGALGGWATVNGSDYAKVQGGNIVAFTAADYVNKDNASNWLANEIISDAGGAANTPYFGTVGSTVQIGGLQYTAAANSTVTVAGGQTFGVDGTIIVAPSVGAANQTITGGSMTGTLGGGVLGIQQNGAGAFTIASTIVDNTGTIGFTKAGTGKVVLSGSSTYTGATTVAQGMLSINSVANAGQASAIGAASTSASNLAIQGATLEYTGATASTDRGFTIARSGAVTSDTISVTNAASNLTFSGQVVSPDGANFIKDGAGTLTLSGNNNSYTGNTTINGGTLAVTTLANGGINSSIGASSSASSSLVLQNGGKLDYLGATATSNRGFTLASAGGIGVSNAATTLTLSGVAAGPGGLTKTGPGTLVLSGTNTYTGGSTVIGGTLRAGSIQAFAPNTANFMTLANTAGVSLDLNGFDNTVGPLSGGGANGGNVTLGSATMRIAGGGGNYSGAISGTGGVLLTNGGIQTFNGCNNTYTGPTNLSGSTVSVGCLANGGVASGIGASSNAATNLVFNSGGLIYTGGTVTTDRGFTLQSTGQIDVTNAATTLTFTGTVTGAGQLQKYGAGTLVLAGNNNNTGGVNVQAGILRAGSATAFGTGSYTLANVAGAVLDLNGYSMSTSVLSGGGPAGGNIQLGAGTLTLTGGTGTYAGLITGTGGLVKAGGGTQVLSGCNSNYTGGTSVTGGVLQVQCLTNGGTNSSIGASSSAAGNLVVNNGILNYVGAGNSTDRLMTIGGTAQILSSGTGAVNFTNTGAIVFANPNTAQTIRLGGTNTNDNRFGLRLDNNGAGVTSFIKQDAGTWILTNPASTYTGVTQILGGVLGVDKLSNGGVGSSIGAASNAASNLVIGSGSTLRYTGSGDSTDRRFTLAVGTTFIESSGTGAVNFANTGAVSYTGTGARVMALGGTNAGDNIMGATIGDQNAANITSLAKNDSGKWILTGSNTYTGITNVNAGTLVIGNGGTTGSIASSTINNAGVLGFNRSDTLTIAGNIQGIGSVQQLGAGTTILTGTNVYTGGTTIAQGTLQLGNGGTTGSIVGDVLDNGTLAFNWNNGNTFAAKISGTGSVHQMGSGTTILTGANSYQGGTSITAGTLQVSSDTNLGAASGGLTFSGGATLNTTASFTSGRATNLQGAGTFSTNSGTTLTLTGAVSGAGALTKAGNGTLILTGNNSYQGATDINAGALFVNGNQTSATGPTSVASGTTLGGTGTIGGSVTVADGGTLNPGDVGSAPGALTINGGLTLNNASNINVNFGQANVPGGPFNDLVNVGGDLRLDGTLNITQTPGGTFGPGVYRVFNYQGSLTDNGLNVTDPNYFVQTSVDKQVNLVNSTGLALSFWDGDAGPHSNSAVNGGDGTWRAAGDQNWTDSAGLFAAPFANASFAIFQGAAGTVSVDNTGGQVQATGMQFATNGYVVQGNPIVLVDDPTQAGLQSIIRVGDGTAVGAAYIATIASNLTGASHLVKTDVGTLVLSGTNSYSGGTAVNGGTLQVSADANLGDAAGGLSLDTGTLHATASFASARGVSIGAGGGTLDTDNLTTLTLTGTVGGVGALTKRGAGTLVLSGPNSYQGGTVINGGTVQITADANLGAAAGTLAFDGGALNTTGSFTSARTTTLNAGGGTFDTDSLTALTLTGAIGGQGALTKTGAGALILGADNSYAGGTTISSGVLRLGTGGTTGSILGDVVDNGTLSFNRSDLYTFDGTISGSGGVSQDGTGNTVLTADNTYTGTTLVAGGGLYINGDQSAATGLTNVNNGTLGGNGIIGGDVFVDIAGRLAPGTLGTTPGTLTITGNLALAGGSNLDYSFGQAGVVGGAYNDLTVVRGDLSLDGTINVTQAAAGSFGPGIYRVISYGGGLTDNGLDTTSSDHIVQTSIAHQVNLVNTAGLVLSYWDGPSPADQNDHAIAGGSGTWRLGGNASWTEADGALNGTFDNGSFAVFAGASGTVGVDNSFGDVHVAGMQFATGGYTIEGGDIALDEPQSIIRVGDGTLPGAGYTATIVSNLTGASQLVKTDLGTLVLSGTNSYSGGTAINGGTLQVAADANLGDAAGAMSFDNGATLQNTATFSSARNVTFNTGGGTFQTDAALTLSGAIGGVGGFSKTGGAALTLTGTNAYAGPTTVTAGALYVDGDNSAATGPTSVGLGATLGGKGAIGGNVVVADGATLSPGSADGTPGTLAIAGDLSLSGGSILNYSFGQANVAGGALNDLTTVGGNLVLDGTLNVSVSAGGTFGPGVYRVFNYNGTLTDNGLSIGTIPSTDYSVQTSIANQVNLVNSDGLTLSYWDGDAGPHSNGVVNGGNGTWRVAGDQNWTDTTGIFAAPFANASFAIFAGAAGTVNVDNTNGQVQAAGMQFATGGYLIQGNDIALVGPTSTIRVGDGTGAGAAYVATINSNLTGNTQLVKTDLGTLVLAGTNSYTGGTAVNGGTLQVASDSNLGAAAGALSFDGGTLRNTASFSSARGVTLNAGGGTFETNADLTLSGMIGGAGALTKTGTSALTLTGANSYSGGTTISAGTLQLGNGGTAGSLTGNVLDNAALVFNRSNSLTYAGVVSGTGVVNQVGTGTTIFTGANTYTGGTTVSAGTLQLGNGGASGSLTGDVLDNATLAFNRSDTYTFAGLISGTGALEQIGSGVTILTANNSYTGATNVSEGTLIVDGNQSAATGTTAVEAGGVLGGIGVVGGNVAVLGGGALNPGNVGLPPGTLTINGDLTLGAAAALNYNFGQANVVGGAFNDLTVVHGDLVLDGQLNVAQTPAGNFGPGIYRVISYEGTLTDLGLSDNSPDYTVQTSIAQQVNLVNTAGLTLSYWDGAAGPKNNGAVNGGDGLWQASAGNGNWTDSTGSVNAPFTDSAFAIFAGAAGTVSVDSSLGGVSASGMQFATGGYLIQGNDIALVGPQSIIRVGDGTAASAAYIATISSSLTGKAQLVKTDLGTLVLAGTNSYTGGTAINGGTLQVASDSNLGAAAGVLSFDGGTLRTTASFNSARAMNLLGQGTVLTDAGTTLTWDGTLAGAGALTKSGAGTLALTANSSGFTGTTAIGGGTLNVSGSLCGRVNVLSGGRLEGTGTVCDTTNAAGGNIAAGNPGAPGTLTVAGNYTGNGGALEIETVLGGDASVTDRLVVTGNTSGTTDLKVTNLGSGGAQTVEGIKVVDVGGASNGTFSLLGDYVFQGQQAVVGGAYAYRLYKNGVNTPADGDWYLRSALVNPTGPQGPLYSPAVPIYEAYPAVLQSLNELGTLQQRVGNRSWTSAAQGADEIGSVPTQNAIWARIETAHSKQSPESATTVSDYDVTTWKLQSGFDGLLYEDATGILLGGLTFHYGTASSDISSIYGVGSIQATGYGFGGTLTWYGDNGFYTDGQAEVTWYDSNLKSATLGTDLGKGNDGLGYALSIEAGQKLALQGKWTLTPQAQLSYSAVRFDGFTDPFDAAVSLSRSEALIGRAGLSLDYEDAWTGAQGKVSRSHLYGIANLYYDFLDGNDVDVSGVSFHEHDQPLWGGLGLGGSLSWADDRYTVFGEAFAKSSLKDFADSNSIGAKLGFSVKW